MPSSHRAIALTRKTPGWWLSEPKLVRERSGRALMDAALGTQGDARDNITVVVRVV